MPAVSEAAERAVLGTHGLWCRGSVSPLGIRKTGRGMDDPTPLRLGPFRAPWPGCLKDCGAEQEEALGVSVAGNWGSRECLYSWSLGSPWDWAPSSGPCLHAGRNSRGSRSKVEASLLRETGTPRQDVVVSGEESSPGHGVD